VKRIDRQAGPARRIFTSHPVDCPASGTKPVRDDACTGPVITRQIPFLANSAAKAAVLFCLPCPKQPARWPVGADPAGDRGGQTVVTVNVPDDAGRFTPTVVTAVEPVLKRDHAGIVAAVLASPL